MASITWNETFLSDKNLMESAVIMAMKNAMKQKTGKNSGVNNQVNIPVTNNPISQIKNTSNATNTTIKKFYIIAGSYPAEQQANDAVADLIRKGFPDAEVVGKNSYGSYRIAYKGYATSEEASKDLIQIRQAINSTAWIFEKK
jgi:cell division protein FtsN